MQDLEKICPKSFACNVVVTLSKIEYIPTCEYQEALESEDGYTSCECVPNENVCWEGEYEENCITIKEMLDELKNYVEQDLDTCEKDTCKGKYLKRLLKACQGWDVESTYIEEV